MAVSDFVQIAFRSESSKQYAIELCKDDPELRKLFVVAPSLFIKPSSYTLAHYLSLSSQRVGLKVVVAVTQGSQWRFVWQGAEGGTLQTSEDRFRRSGRFEEFWNYLSVTDLPPGDYRVSFFLDDIRQLELNFVMRSK